MLNIYLFIFKFSLIAIVLILTSCSNNLDVQPVDPDLQLPPRDRQMKKNLKTGGGSILGGLNLFNKGDQNQGSNGGSLGIGVNAFIWQASLETISFMPLLSADPFGGVIITDWYSSPSKPYERYKITILIKSRTLRADGLEVSFFKQTSSDGSNNYWTYSKVSKKTALEIENTILTKASEMSINNINSN